MKVKFNKSVGHIWYTAFAIMQKKLPQAQEENKMKRIEDRSDTIFRLRSGAIIGHGQYTGVTCYRVIKSKGYEIEMKSSKSDYAETYDECDQTWYAAKDGRIFEAINCTELLGLIALWEHGGDSCMEQDTEDDVNEYWELIDNSPLLDTHGDPCVLDEGYDDDEEFQ